MSLSSSQKRFLIMAGGTGGHVYPALSLAAELRSRGHLVDWLGTQRGIETRLVPAADIKLHVIDVFGIRGKGIGAILKAPFTILRALLQARSVVSAVAPNVLVGFGGFAAGPGGLAGRISRLPLVIHEQNARAGTTNKLLARIATRVLSAFPGALDNAEVVGNPVRRAMVDMPPPDDRARARDGKLRLLVIGGSLGATFLNDSVAQALAKLEVQRRPFVMHQCGERWLKDCRAAYESADVQAEVVPYIEDMAGAYASADFMICRAGAMTVSEIAAVGIPALFVPFPYAIDDHQTANANWLVEAGAARVVQQAELTPDRMQAEIEHFLIPREQLAKQGNLGRSIAKVDATDRIADVCEELADVA